MLRVTEQHTVRIPDYFHVTVVSTDGVNKLTTSSHYYSCHTVPKCGQMPHCENQCREQCRIVFTY